VTVRYEGPVLERGLETDALEGLLAAAIAGSGGVMVLDGGAGVGKTTLLRQTIARAGELGIRVLRATGSELETGFPHGIARQLLERAIDELLDAVPPAAPSDALLVTSGVLDGESTAEWTESAGPGAVHALYRVTRELAGAQPLLLAVDDAHWADVASLQFLHYLARRVSGSPVALLIAARPVDVATAPPALAALLSYDEAVVLRPGELSEAATTELARAMLGREPDAEFVTACVRMTGGNAFLVTELLRELSAEGVEPSAASVPALARRAPGAVRHRVGAWLRGLSAATTAVAGSLAVLGEAELPLLARHAGVSVEQARDACDQLERLGVLEGSAVPRLAHPLIAAAVAATIPSGERSLAHRRAAELLREQRAPLDAQAVQLLASRPEGAPWIAALLHEAAVSALARGAPAEAVGYLVRALSEPPAPELTPAVLLELGRAQVRMGEYAEAQATLCRGLEAGGEDATRTELGVVLSHACFLAGDIDGALAALETAQQTEHDPARRLALDGNALTLGLLEPAHAAPMRQRLARYRAQALAGELKEPVVLAMAGAQSVLESEPLGEGIALVRRAFGAGLSAFGDHTFAYGWGLCALDAADLSTEAIVHLDRALAEARARADVAIICYLMGYRNRAMLRLGRLAEAEADGRAAMELLQFEEGASFSLTLIEILVERGLAEEAGELCEEWTFKGSEQRSAMVELVTARVEIARGREADALPRLLRTGEMLDAMGFLHGQFAPWRALAATVAHTLGDGELAARLAAEGRRLAERSGAPTALAQALRVDGIVSDDIALLARSVALAAGTPDLLEHAKSLVAYGSAQLAAGLRAPARETLRDGLATAHEAGALALAQTARGQLVAAGGRPRRVALRGVEALTPSELQVAQLAEEGLSNRDISDGLFVSLKTVEQHLARAYAKLEISGRHELGPALRG
jgi:DNA-binding NarL/FixJ family response regulator